MFKHALRRCLFAFLFFLPFLANSQVKITDIQGKWLEEKRSMKKEKNIDFQDTIRMEIREDGFMMMRMDNGGTFVGSAELSDHQLTLEDLRFDIEDYSQDQLVLTDKRGSHYFNKKLEFTASPVARIAPLKEGGKKVDTKTLQGKWTMYKKTDPDYQPSTFYIRMIQFTSEYNQGSYMTKVTFNNADSVYTSDAVIKANGNQLSISAGSKTINVYVLDSDSDDELILEDGAIHYYMKQFGKKN